MKELQEHWDILQHAQDPSLSRRALSVEQLNTAIPRLIVAAKLLKDEQLDSADWVEAGRIVRAAERLRERLTRPVLDAERSTEISEER